MNDDNKVSRSILHLLGFCGYVVGGMGVAVLSSDIRPAALFPVVIVVAVLVDAGISLFRYLLGE